VSDSPKQICKISTQLNQPHHSLPPILPSCLGKLHYTTVKIKVISLSFFLLFTPLSYFLAAAVVKWLIQNRVSLF